MKRLLLNLLKSVSVAALYATAAFLVCATARTCLWEPFRHLYADNSVAAWPAFVGYYDLLVLVTTVLVSFTAAHSYRPSLYVGVITGCGAVLLFRLAERTTHSAGRQPDLIMTILLALFLGLLFGLLGSTIRRKQAAQPGAPPASVS